MPNWKKLYAKISGTGSTPQAVLSVEFCAAKLLKQNKKFLISPA
jgi:hypothetical protein